MAIDLRFFLFCAVIFQALFTPIVFAAGDEIIEEAAEEYFYELDASGRPVFSQVIEWEEDQGALKYILEISLPDGTVVHSRESVTSMQVVSLPAGKYLYRITVFNLLGKSEAAAEWSPMEVKKALKPVIRSFSPGTIFIEEENFHFVIRGTDISPETSVYLDDPVLGIHRIEPVKGPDSEEGKLELEIPADKIDAGTYRISVTNPGGLKDRTEETITIRYINPFEFFGTIGWSGWIPLYDSWYTTNWNGGFYPVGFDATFSWVIKKRRTGFFGIQAQFGARIFNGGEEGITIETANAEAGLALMWKYKLSKEIFLIGTAGGGFTWTKITFDYSGTPGMSDESVDPHACAGLDVQYLLRKNLLLGAGVRYRNVFYQGKSIGGISPVISVGKFF
jgi:hypothetical protein